MAGLILMLVAAYGLWAVITRGYDTVLEGLR